MATVPAPMLLLSLLTVATVLGCGPGVPNTMSSRTFKVTFSSLPLPMAFSTAPAATAQAAGISTSADTARGFVMRLIMQAVFDVLEQQGRAAGLPDAIIQIILDQLTVSVNYQPLECKQVEVNPANPAAQIAVAAGMEPKCIIIGNTVTAICNMQCMLNNGMMVLAIPAQHLSISDHGELVDRDVARRGEQSDSNPGIGSVRTAFLFGNCYRLMKQEVSR